MRTEAVRADGVPLCGRPLACGWLVASLLHKPRKAASYRAVAANLSELGCSVGTDPIGHRAVAQPAVGGLGGRRGVKGLPHNMTKCFRSGFVSILGRPNVGKSTLLNKLLGAKVAIVSNKPQTTRTSIQGVLNLDDAQIVFLDTPGIHRPDTPINRRMMQSVTEALDGRDLLLFLHDATTPIRAADQQALTVLKGVKTPVFLVLNKIDRVKPKSKLLPLMERYQQVGTFQEIFPVSARTGDGLDRLREAIVGKLPEGPRYFPEDHLTDQPERFFAAEIIREKVLHLTHQEVPHSILVEVEKWEETPKLLRLGVAVLVERAGQKAIIIGARGQMIKQIGADARVELERLLGRKIFLELFVKVREQWRQKPAYLDEIDWKR